MKFSLEHIAEADPRMRLAYVGDWQADIFFLDADVGAVDEHLLPDPLKPGPQSLTRRNRHPVVIMIGKQQNVRPEFAHPDLTALQMNYLEAIVAVPYVQWEDATPPDPPTFVCSKVLYLDQALPTVLGWLAGFPKRVGQLNSTDTTWDVNSNDGQPLLNFQLTVDQQTPPRNPSDFPNFAPLRSLFQQTHVGRLIDPPGELFDVYACAKLDLRLDQAKMSPIKVQGTLSPEFCPAVPTTFSFNGIDVSPLGAFRLITRWRLTPPHACPR